jgi:hypothetical protein
MAVEGTRVYASGRESVMHDTEQALKIAHPVCPPTESWGGPVN